MAKSKIDLSAGMIPKKPMHPLGEITGWSHNDGLPIVRRKETQANTAEIPAQKQENTDEKPTKTSDKPTDSVKPAASSEAKPMAKTRLEPANLTKGQSVSLRDGTGATVAHVIDDKSVRVRTEAGKNTVVKRAEVTPHILVKAHLRRMPS
jgi:preprotein translocase subunit YajC